MAIATTSSRSTKIRAIVAGGLVLGFGAAGTIAAWNDSEEATGNFTAGQFGIEGSPDGTNFTESPTPPKRPRP
ncbi:MAG TPA: SipW-dependent-type signal peptide-containing protein [Enteractinococcus sp.]